MKIYKVGGAIRDSLMGVKSYDNDWVVVGSSPEEMVSNGFKPIGKDFPVFLHPETHEEDALARTEKKNRNWLWWVYVLLWRRCYFRRRPIKKRLYYQCYCSRS